MDDIDQAPYSETEINIKFNENLNLKEGDELFVFIQSRSTACTFSFGKNSGTVKTGKEKHLLSHFFWTKYNAL